MPQEVGANFGAEREQKERYMLVTKTGARDRNRASESIREFFRDVFGD